MFLSWVPRQMKNNLKKVKNRDSYLMEPLNFLLANSRGVNISVSASWGSNNDCDQTITRHNAPDQYLWSAQFESSGVTGCPDWSFHGTCLIKHLVTCLLHVLYDRKCVFQVLLWISLCTRKLTSSTYHSTTATNHHELSFEKVNRKLQNYTAR
jgi:hypothetical protein